MSTFDWSTVKKMVIPEGEVTSLSIGGVQVWKKAAEVTTYSVIYTNGTTNVSRTYNRDTTYTIPSPTSLGFSIPSGKTFSGYRINGSLYTTGTSFNNLAAAGSSTSATIEYVTVARNVDIKFGPGIAKVDITYTPSGGSATTKSVNQYNANWESKTDGHDATSEWWYDLSNVVGDVKIQPTKYFNNYSKPADWSLDYIVSGDATSMTVTPTLASIPAVSLYSTSPTARWSYYHIGGSVSGKGYSVGNDMGYSFMEIVSQPANSTPSATDIYYQLILNANTAKNLFKNGAPVYAYSALLFKNFNYFYADTRYSSSVKTNGFTAGPQGSSSISMQVPALTWELNKNAPTYNYNTSVNTNYYIDGVAHSDDIVYFLKLGTASGDEWQVAWPTNSSDSECPDATYITPITQMSTNFRPEDSDYYYHSDLQYFSTYQPSTNNGTISYYCSDGQWYNKDGSKYYYNDPPICSGTAVISTGLSTYTTDWNEISKYFYYNYDTGNFFRRHIFCVWDAGWVCDP